MKKIKICTTYFGVLTCYSRPQATLRLIKGAEEVRDNEPANRCPKHECLKAYAEFLEAIKKGRASLEETKTDLLKWKLRQYVEPHVAKCDICHGKLMIMLAELSG